MGRKATQEVEEWANELSKLPDVINKRDLNAVWSIFEFAQNSARKGLLRLVGADLEKLGEIIQEDVHHLIRTWGELLDKTADAATEIRKVAVHNISTVSLILQARDRVLEENPELAKATLQKCSFQQLIDPLQPLLTSYSDFLASINKVQKKLRRRIRIAKIKRYIFMGVAGISVGVLCLSVAAAVLCTAGLVATPALAGAPALALPLLAACGLVVAGVGVAGASAAIPACTFGNQVCKELKSNAEKTKAVLDQLEKVDLPTVRADINRIIALVKSSDGEDAQDTLPPPDGELQDIEWQVLLQNLRDENTKKMLRDYAKDLKVIRDKTRALHRRTLDLKYQYDQKLSVLENDLAKLFTKHGKKVEPEKKVKGKEDTTAEVDYLPGASLLPKQEDTNVPQSSSAGP